MLHGNRTYLLQDANGQIIETHSVSAGLDYPGVGPEHAWLKDTGRAEYVVIDDEEALRRVPRVLPHRGHHSRARIGARAGLREEARADAREGQDPARQSLRPRRQGHGDGGGARRAKGRTLNRIDATFAKLRESRRTALIPYVTTGDPSLAATLPIMKSLVAAGADVIELGVPFSDPMADGPVIQRASERALAQHVSLADVLEVVAEFRKGDTTTPIVLMGYANPIEAMGVTAFAERAQDAGVDGVLVVDYPPEEASDFAKAHGRARHSRRSSCSRRRRRRRASRRSRAWRAASCITCR